MKLLSNSLGLREEWLAIWDRVGREPFAHPDYVNLFASQHDKVHALYWNDETSGLEVLLPIILRSLPESFQTLTPNWFDAVSPYGYGGPYSTRGMYIPLERFWLDVLDWMRVEKILTLFVRASIFEELPTELPIVGTQSFTVLHLNDNIVVDTRRSPEDQWRHYDHKVRKNVNKAQRAGLVVNIQKTYSSVSDFVEIYSSTMQRRSASGWYHFGQDFFQSFSNDLIESHLVAEVRDSAGKLISVELVLKSDQFLYSFLGGTLREAFAYAPNDLLKHAVIEYGYQNNLIGYVLGGGYQRDDGIFRYKRAFDSHGVIGFYGLQLVADQNLVADLTDVHQKSAAEAGMSLQTGFFPAYRSPKVSAAEASDPTQDVK